MHSGPATGAVTASVMDKVVRKNPSTGGFGWSDCCDTTVILTLVQAASPIAPVDMLPVAAPMMLLLLLLLVI